MTRSGAAATAGGDTATTGGAKATAVRATTAAEAAVDQTEEEEEEKLESLDSAVFFSPDDDDDAAAAADDDASSDVDEASSRFSFLSVRCSADGCSADGGVGVEPEPASRDGVEKDRERISHLGGDDDDVVICVDDNNNNNNDDDPKPTTFRMKLVSFSNFSTFNFSSLSDPNSEEEGGTSHESPMIPENLPPSDSADTSLSPSTGAPFCRICLDSDDAASLIAPCLCRGSGALCHSSCLQTWLRTREKAVPKKKDILECGVCKGRYGVTIAYEKRGKRTSNKKDVFKIVLWLYCLLFVVFSPLLIFRSCVDYILSRSPHFLFLVVLNCLGFVVYLYFTIYAINAWIFPAADRWLGSNLQLVVRPNDVEAAAEEEDRRGDDEADGANVPGSADVA